MAKLLNKVAIVTGGGCGIGLTYSLALAEQGAKVVIADIIPDSEIQQSLAVTDNNYNIDTVNTDVSDEQSVINLVEKTIAKHSTIDIVVNNAAIFSTLDTTDVNDIDVDLWDKIMAVNVKGSFLLCKHATKIMKEKQSGKIINISSGVAYKGMARMSHYSSSKGAVLSLTRSLARELGAYNICVNTLAPGLIMSDSIAANQGHIDDFRKPVLQSRSIKRDGYPKDLIGALLFLAGSDSDFITGQTIAVDGGSVNT